MFYTQFFSHTMLIYKRERQLLFLEKKKKNSNKMGMKQQPKTNIQTHTIKQTHLDQVMHLSFYWEKNNDLTGFFKAFDPPFHIFENLKTWK